MMDDDDADHTLIGSSSSSKKQKYRPLHSEPLVVDSKLAAYLKEEWAFGRMSPQQAQLIAKHACSDLTSALAFGKKLGIEVSQPDLERLDTLGAGGLHPGNMHRDMERTIDSTGLPDLMPIRLPVKDKQNDTVVLDEQFILFPHMLFSYLYHNFQSVFIARLLCMAGDIEAFWEGVAHTDQYREHPLRHRRNHKHHCIPILLHGNGVHTTGVGKAWTKMLDVFSWGSLLAVDGKAMLTNFLIFACWTILSSKDPGFDTYDEHWLATRWSLEAMYERNRPLKDHKGKKYDTFAAYC